MRSKIDRELYGPGWIEVTFGALLSLSIGVILAGAWLMLKPVEKVQSLPKNPVAGTVYFIPGARDSFGGSSWKQKSQLFVGGGSVALSERELNAAAEQMATPATKKNKDAKDALLTPGSLNFRIANGELQVALPLALNIYGMRSEVLMVARGDFVKRGEHFVYQPNSVTLGSCSVGRLPKVGSVILNKIWEAMAQQDAVRNAWDGLANVTVEESTLRLEAR